MKDLVQRILTEMTSQPTIGSDPLVQMLVDSTNKSIELGESIETVYGSLKNGIVSINAKLNSPALTLILENIKRNENTVDSQVVKLAKKANLSAHLQSIKESESYSNPIVKTKVESFDSALLKGVLDFSICDVFVESFKEYSYDKKITKAIGEVRSYLAENRSQIVVLNAIYQMNSPVYAGASNDLKNLLVTESYSADILKMKYGVSVPVITSLISELRVLESRETGSFTLGEGNFDTHVNNLITPSIRIEEGILLYVDDRFISIRESKSLTGNERKLHIDDRFKIAEVDPNFVKEGYSTFYQVCEAFATLGFNLREDGLGVESKNIPKLTIGFILNEKKDFDLYVNGHKMESAIVQNVSEALSMHNSQTRTKVNLLLENFSTVCNLEFVKTVVNHRTMAEATVFDIEGTYFVCEKLNAAERSWTKMNEHEMYQFFGSKFNYDISPIFKIQIEESMEILKAIEKKKASIQRDIQKLEESVLKLSAACSNTNLDPSEISKLEAIKESIESSIHGLKQEYINVDLLKKKQLA